MQLYQQMLGKYNNSTPQQKNYLGLGLTLGLLIILLALIFPAVNHILKLNREITDARGVEKKLQEKIIALDEAETNYTESKNRLTIVDDALPTGSGVDSHLKQLERLAAKNKVSLAGLQFSDIPLSIPTNTVNLAVKQIEYSVTVEGKFSNINGFVSDLEKTVRTVDITSLSVSEDENIISATINATINYLGKPSARSAQNRSNNQTTGNNIDIPVEGQ